MLLDTSNNDSNGFVIRGADSLQQAFDIFNKIYSRRVKREGIPINITDWNGYEEMLEMNKNTIKEYVYHRVGDTVWDLSRIVFNEGELVISPY